MALGAFQGAQKDVDAQKRALLQAVAERGQAGQASFEAQQKAAQAMRAEAVRGVSKDMGLHAPPAALAGQLGQIAGGPGDVYAAEAATQGAAFGAGIGQIGAANKAYMGQVKAAVPVVESVTERTVARIRAEREAELARQKHEAEMRRLEASESAADREQARLIREHELRGMAHTERGWAADAAGADGERGKDLKPRSPQEVAAATGIDVATQGRIQTNRSYPIFAEAMTEAYANGYSAQETHALLQQVAAQQSAITGNAGYDTTLRYLWAMAGHNFGRDGQAIATMYAAGSGGARPLSAWQRSSAAQGPGIAHNPGGGGGRYR